MKTLIQKIHVEEHYSFACRTYKTPDFETAWHKHLECELILITEGNGTALIGDYIGEYKEGDVFLMDTNVPHWFRKSQKDSIGSVIVIHFLRDFWGDAFLALPEMKNVARLLDSKNTGIQLQGDLSNDIAFLIRQLEHAEGIERIQLLLTCLQKISTSADQKVITTAFATVTRGEENSVIETIIDYSFKHFLDPISLKEVAGITKMSIPAFCRFFKRNIKKSYFDFIKEIRIGHACKLLRETNRPVLDICYDSGYNSWAHFSKQFKTVTKIPPSQYRKQHIK
ncbi:AraC-like DNA-binding protein [Pedobacter cryoconitis]|uniref:AraC-like DNA-binding protein n=1 Tax=Pedobacter cryoconitis TaxID=188932 RepID=A0A7W9E1P7_9SPHI|nr:AraC family transcriptional regulator [Pedobacter cryoconitis]MBB5638469.1 AraC-like DNA-binding protein [Pedobacter cryoconitis]MBB6270656.1 AraC-like DNA-binding protein [Pedobacter cryoconitis]